MKTIKTPLFVITFLISLFWVNVEGAYAQSLQCSFKQPDSLRVMVTTNPVKKNNTKSVRQLQSFQIDTVNPFGRDAITEIGGLMSGGLQFKSSMNIAWETDGQQSCFWYNKIEITLHIDPTIYIARKHRPGTCKYNAILEHEMKHVKADQDVAIEWRPVIERELRRQIRNLGAVGPFPNNQQRRVRQQMTERISTLMSNLSEQVNKDRFNRQQAIDSREEYERVNAMCRS